MMLLRLMHKATNTGTGLLPVPTLKYFFPCLLGWVIMGSTACASLHQTASQQRIQQLIAITKDESQASYYQFRDGEAREPKEKQWALIERENQHWHYTEIYSTFLRPDGNTDYGLLEMTFDPAETQARFPVLEYDLRTSSDSSWYEAPTLRQGQVSGSLKLEFDNQPYELYRLLGYAHQDDPTYGHLKYWSPVFGTVLIWFGEERFFELVEPREKEKIALLKVLQAKALEDLEKEVE